MGSGAFKSKKKEVVRVILPDDDATDASGPQNAPGADAQWQSDKSASSKTSNNSNRHRRTSQPIGPSTAYALPSPTDNPGNPPKKRNSVSKHITPETRKWLVSMVQNHFIFGTMQESEFDAVFMCLGVVHIETNEVVFKQGDAGDSCYFIHSGSYKVSIDGKDLKTLGPNDSFGELALLYQMVRSATITCTQPGELWQMDQTSFKSCMEKLSSTQARRAEAFFRQDTNFCGLPTADLKLLAGLCSSQQFNEGEEVLREGEVGHWMFIITSGKVVPTDTRMAQMFDRPGAIIGCLGLIYGKRQSVGARAKGAVTCLALARSALSQLTEHVEDVLRRCAFKDLLHSLPRSSDQREFFRFLTEEQQHKLISTAEDGIFEPGEIIAAPGDQAQLIVVIDGEVAVVPSFSGPFREDGDHVFVGNDVNVRDLAEQMLTDGMGYGESPELLDGVAISQFVIAVTEVRMHRITYECALSSLGEPLLEVVRVNEIKKVLQDIFLFKNLRDEQMEKVVRKMEKKSFAAGEVVVQQGDPAKHFFLIQSGTIVVKKGEQTLRTLGRWDYFGERGLLLSELRSATCQALDDCVCLSLDDDAFFDIVGMFRRELERRMHLQDLNITMGDLKCKAVVGRGTFGVVRLVYPKTKERALYALKCVKKWHVVKTSQEKAIVIERDVNAQCYHPCIVQFIKTFQDKQNIYFLTEFLGGGDLFFALREIGSLTKIQSQFFSGSIALGLEYLHGRGIMYRDLKPENVLLDFEGLAKLVDFGCCKQEMRTATLIGTPEYMAPEVISGKGYTCIVDWWSLGVMLHEFTVGPLPFGANTDDQMAIFRSILNDPLIFPKYVTDGEAQSIVMGMLDKDPTNRLGSSSKGAKEIKEQAYYSGFNWDALAGGFHEPPWKPNVDAQMKNWEPPDGDVLDHVSKESFKLVKAMEWAEGF